MSRSKHKESANGNGIHVSTTKAACGFISLLLIMVPCLWFLIGEKIQSLAIELEKISKSVSEVVPKVYMIEERIKSLEEKENEDRIRIINLEAKVNQLYYGEHGRKFSHKSKKDR